jgi:hypothetical protein
VSAFGGRARLGVATLAVLLLLGSCSSATKAPLWVAPHVDVTMKDYSFQYNAGIPSGRVLFRVVNAGTRAHRLTLVPMTDDMPPINVQLHGAVRSTIAPFAGVRALPPQTTDSFAVDLVPGRRYAMICFLKDPGVTESHALMGMNSEFRAGPRPSTGP